MARRQQNCQALYRIAPRTTDLGPLADLWVASWHAAMPSIDFAARRDWFFTYVASVEQAGGETHCAFDDAGQLLGFILVDLGRGVLEQIVVAPERFGDGLGAILLGHAKALSMSLCRSGLSLDVNVDNPRACRFYEKHGFLKLGEGLNARSGLPIWHMRWEAK